MKTMNKTRTTHHTGYEGAAAAHAHALFGEAFDPMAYVGNGIVEMFARIDKEVRGISARIRRRRRISATVRELSNLDDHVLKDIGVARCEIMWIAEHAEDNGGRRFVG